MWRHCDGVLKNLIERQRTLLQALRQSFAFEVFHYQVIGSVLMADVVKRADVRMVQAGDRTGFTIETLAQFSTICKVIWQDFYCDRSVEARITGALHLAHATRSNCGKNFVGAQALVRLERHLQPPNWAKYNAEGYLYALLLPPQ